MRHEGPPYRRIHQYEPLVFTNECSIIFFKHLSERSKVVARIIPSPDFDVRRRWDHLVDVTLSIEHQQKICIIVESVLEEVFHIRSRLLRFKVDVDDQHIIDEIWGRRRSHKSQSVLRELFIPPQLSTSSSLTDRLTTVCLSATSLPNSGPLVKRVGSE